MPGSRAAGSVVRGLSPNRRNTGPLRPTICPALGYFVLIVGTWGMCTLPVLRDPNPSVGALPPPIPEGCQPAVPMAARRGLHEDRCAAHPQDRLQARRWGPRLPSPPSWEPPPRGRRPAPHSPHPTRSRALPHSPHTEELEASSSPGPVSHGNTIIEPSPGCAERRPLVYGVTFPD